ncbi:MAG TPA: hypothetical protein VN861_03220 [Candidatus Acidoferrales bacterium]|nr:hypothetical protein [Candidatus Acidoferrales bacterium]
MAVKPKFDNFDAHTVPQRNMPASVGAHIPPVRTAATSLDTWTDPKSVRTRQEYDWRNGGMKTVTPSIIDHARASVNRGQFKSVTAERTHPSPVNDYCFGGAIASSPAVPKSKSKSLKKKGR